RPREKPVNLQLSRIKPALRMVLGLDAVEPVDRTSILSGTPAQIIHYIFEQAFTELHPKRIQLLVEESNSARMFLWHSDREKEGFVLVNSEEFDHSSADPYLQLMPGGDWILHNKNGHDQFLTFDSRGSWACERREKRQEKNGHTWPANYMMGLSSLCWEWNFVWKA